jgi:hypothetical protein
MAQEMGKKLGQCRLLLGKVPPVKNYEKPFLTLSFSIRTYIFGE